MSGTAVYSIANVQHALQALEALEERYVGALRDKAMDALRTALAEPEQKPVAWGVFEDRNLHDPCFTRKDAEELARLKGTHAVVQPLYTHPVYDTALLRQALDCLENHVMQRTYASGVVICNTAIALRERLGEKT